MICKGGPRRAIVALALIAGASAIAQQGTKIHMHRDSGYAADGFLYEPSGSVPAGGVLLIHDARGITDFVREEAQRLALAGCVVVAIDLYRGRTAGESQTPAQLASGLAADEVMHDLEAAIDFLQVQPNILGKPIGVVGWGLGGDFAIRLVLAGAQVRGVAITVAKLPYPAELAHLEAALLANVAGPDNPRLATAERQLHKRGKEVDIKVYSRARDNFFDPLDVSDFRPAPRRTAADRSLYRGGAAQRRAKRNSALVWMSPDCIGILESTENVPRAKIATPLEADAALIINADAVRTLTVTLQRFKAIAG